MAYNAPSSRSTGDLINATIWNADIVANIVAIYAAGLSVTSQAIGDILYASSTTQFARVGIGSANKVLTSSGSAPQWSTSLDLAGTLGVAGAVTFNDAGADVDFRVESDDGTHTLFVDGGADTVGINNSAPGSQFEVAGDATNTNIDSAQIQIVGASDANQQLRIGYHTGSDYGWIQAVKQGTDQKPLILQAAGGKGVGIGSVTAPDGTLHVHTATAGSVTAGSGADDLVVENSTHVGMTFLSPSGDYQQTIAFGDVGDADSGRIVYDHDSNMLQFWTEGTRRMNINSAGKVGIGNDTPDASRLDLGLITDSDATLSTTVSDYQFNVGSATTSGEYGHAICFSDGSTISAAINGYDRGSSGGMALRFATMSTAGAFSDALTIDHNKNVGIGTVWPDTLLHIANTGPASIITLDNRTTAIAADDVIGAIYFALGDEGNISTHKVRAKIVSTSGGSAGAVNIRFYTGPNADTAATEKMRLSAEGYLGIGSVVPASPLHVAKSSSGALSLLTLQNTNSATNDSCRIDFLNTSSVPGTVKAIIEAKRLAPSPGAEGTELNFYTTTTTGSPTLRMKLEHGGNVVMSGGLEITGSLSKGSGSFKIDHPLPAKTESHHLIHSFVECPETLLIYRGSVTLVAGQGTVDLDDAAGMATGTWVLLCRDEQCFTSNETGWFHVRGSVTGSTLTIDCEEADCTDTVSWMVVANRKDSHIMATAWTDENGYPIVEPEKVEEEEYV